MADLFETTSENITMHLKRIFTDVELEEKATTRDFLAVQTEGKRRVSRTIKHYNLDAIISVGYRVNSKRGVRFRQWATNVLRRHILQGYTLNQTRLAELGFTHSRRNKPGESKSSPGKISSRSFRCHSPVPLYRNGVGNSDLS